MATHAHSTRTPLLPRAGAGPALLGQGSGRQPGPVTLAIRAVRSGEPRTAADRAIDAIRDGLDRHFAEGDRQRVRELRRAIADRIEADIVLLDVLDPDADLEDGADGEPSLCGVGTHPGGALNGMHPSHLGDDREAGDDTGIGDTGGLAEQCGRHLHLIAGRVE